MNKRDIAIVAVLFAVLLGWMVMQRGAAQRKAAMDRATPRGPARESVVPPAGGAATASTGAVARSEAPEGSAAPQPAVSGAAAPEAAPAGEAGPDAVDAPLPPPTLVTLTNGLAEVTVSSRGAAIISLALPGYRETIDPASGPVRLDFSARPTASLSGAGRLGAGHEFSVVSAGARAVEMARDAGDGTRLRRTLSLEPDGYSVRIEDEFSNTGAVARAISAHGMNIGPMGMIWSAAKMTGISYLGLDTLASHGGEGVRHWSGKLQGLFGVKQGFLSRRADMAGVGSSASRRLDDPVAWVAVKNKFFVQILAPDEEAAGCELLAARDMTVSNALAIGSVSAAVFFPEKVLQPGQSWKRAASWYGGPKKLTALRRLGNHREGVMEFGFFGPVCGPLLWTLNYLYLLIPDYGVAIILLTALVRLVFWPVTHKSTESMKRMQELQPQVSQIKEKFKDKPQKMNQEIMALYREKKVNPMSGCLPVLVQIPVFIALYTVLRSAIELRFAPFLWIRDLSEPEGLLAGKIPVLGSLNVLPLLMTATTVWQQKLTPSTGDPQQQKMMMIMPVVMLFIFYSMPSALVLYWTTSQCLAIAQLLMQRRRGQAAGEPAARGGEAAGRQPGR